MNRLFKSITINNLEITNRFVRSATWEGLATQDGAVTSSLIERLVELAKGGVGLITTSHAYVSPEGQGTIFQLGIYKDELIPGYQKLTDAVHKHGARIFLQLAHAGIYANGSCQQTIPSVVSTIPEIIKDPCHELSIQEIQKLVKAYEQAAVRAQKAGFDGIQIHTAHGYLLSQFLSPAFNHRNDVYGGSLENRMRIHREIIKAIRQKVGHHYPITVKMNCEDFVKNGIEIEETLKVAKFFSGTGIDAIELSGGIIRNGQLAPSRQGINRSKQEAYFRTFAKKIKKQIGIPLILVGGVRSMEVACELIKENTSDMISMSRPLICEPDLINRWKSGDHTKAKCVSCNQCFQPGFQGKGISCILQHDNS